MMRGFRSIDVSCLVLCSLAAGPVDAQIPVPTDAPAARSPEESRAQVQLPPGFELELVASEPLVREPSGVCWDEQGRLFVSELHGYNLEGQYDIDALNRTGQLDREVRRIQANPQAKEAARAGTYGTVKVLFDRDGDGRMDEARVFADRLPPAYGICPARGGVIVACAPDIVYLADRDGDDVAEVRETLFTGFGVGALERGINAPQWGLDDWIYFGSGHGGGTITGPHLAAPVVLGGSDFRIKADGSAIEPIVGGTHTFGHAFGEFGERFVVTTSQAGRYVAPIAWRYLARNPDAAAPGLELSAGDYSRVFPISKPHPWRTRRAEDPGFYKYYRDRYGAGDSEAGGYFTSGCGPLVYQDVALPREFRGAYFFCEPAQNFIHRAVIERDGPVLRLRRAPGEQESEFLASRDVWFHPMHLIHGPEGGIYVIDLYREIIEDYSAIPRYLQQQYGLTNGIQHGRVWRLTHRDAPKAPDFNMSRLSVEALAREVVSPHYWRRQTARRLLVEREGRAARTALKRLMSEEREPGRLLNAHYTLDALGLLEPEQVLGALGDPSVGIRVHGLRFAERFLMGDPRVVNRVLSMVEEEDGALLLQLALTLGETPDPRSLTALARLAREHGDVRWMPTAILSSVHGRSAGLLEALLAAPDGLGMGTELLEPLGRSLGAGRDVGELKRLVWVLGKAGDAAAVARCLRGVIEGRKEGEPVLRDEADRAAFEALLSSGNADVRRLASELSERLFVPDPVRRRERLARAARDAGDLDLPVGGRLAAVQQLAVAKEAEATDGLVAAWAPNTPRAREAILDALFARKDRVTALVAALESGAILPASLTAFQRITLLENDLEEVRQRAGALLGRVTGPDDATYHRFAAALSAKAEPEVGERVFRENCATCHRLRGIGFAVGPDLGAEFQRSREAILRDILAPNDVLTAGYATYAVETRDGQVFHGILAGESATSVTLNQPGGLEQVVLRKDIERLHALPVSLMPEALVDSLSPGEAAAVISWLRGGEGSKGQEAGRVVLFDDEAEFVIRLRDGAGRATLEHEGAYAGEAFLAVTPPQRYAVRLPGWLYRITENPGQGEFRYLRLAWRTRDGDGVMIELAADGRWPDASDARRRYFSGKNTTDWRATEVASAAPGEWRSVTVDLWKDNGDFTLTGIAPTAMGGVAHFDRIELLRDLRSVERGPERKDSGVGRSP